MKVKELISLYRTQSLDKVSGKNHGDIFSTNEELILYANEAQVEACRRSELLLDSTGPMCTHELAPGQRSISLDGQVLTIRRAYIGAQPVRSVDAQWLDDSIPGWEDDERCASPMYLVTGMDSNSLYLYPKPSNAVTLRLTVSRLPKVLAGDDDEPEIRAEHHAGLVEWMLFRAYSREDNDLYNDTKAALCLRRFEAEFGSKVSARNETWMRQAESVLPGPIA
ncbi:DUF6682 family protein [Comamonas sp. NoAH]|uniref:phage adaptor protein n=1 Tax=Comamonas halotolerans TaxID=3041496 RepID=UPI0024E115CB|nr:DUF6682 family protein [Comamonas sp. NoAH]